jgi:radical SAM protein with 4Fe4S-binding SPASM domain
MIRFTHLLHGGGTVSRVYHQRTHPTRGLLAYADPIRPVVFWNITRQCNLSCRHCYLDAGPGRAGEDELTTPEARLLIDDLSSLGIPLLIVSGGEPLTRDDIWELLSHARDRGMALALSSNGTLITPGIARQLKRSGVEYVGISLDGADRETHEMIRDVPGCFDSALAGLGHCRDAGIKTGVRFTATKENYSDIDRMIDLSRRLGTDRFCVYWLVPSGRGAEVYGEGRLAPMNMRTVLDTLYRSTQETGPDAMEFLTVDAPQDIVYLLERLESEDPKAHAGALELLDCRGAGCSAGSRVASIGPAGDVYPCQFAQSDRFRIGSVRERPFSALWNDAANPVLREFRNKTGTLQGACAACRYRMVCGGGCRVRAWYATGDFCAGDPFCEIVAHSGEPGPECR